MADSFNIDDFNDLEAKYKRLLELQQKATSSLSGYNELLKSIKEIARSLKFIKEQEAKIDSEIKKLELERERVLARETKLLGKNKALQSDSVKEVEKEIAARKKALEITKKQTEQLEESAAEMAQMLNSSNLLSASFVTLGRGIVGAYKGLKDMSKEMLKQQKATYLTEQSMGILNSQSNAFRMNMYKSSGLTQKLSVNTADLAKMQGAYSEQIGRSVVLSQDGLVAMAEISKGTMMGAEGAAEMAASMDNMGLSVIGTRDVVQEMMDLSSKMGVNSVKVTANLKKNMQLANRYHFKDGVKGMVKLAAEAAKMHLDMEGIATMADKVFRPEGAVEMAARLQTIGGEFAKLGDPFTLMFKARNDFEGFAKDVGNATSEFAKFNKESGQFDISGAGLDRIREIADITGISADKLAEMGRETAKIKQIEMNIGGGITDEDNIAFISSVAQFDNITGQWQVMVDGQTENIKNLRDNQVKEMVQEKKSLAERAKQAQSFDETWTNIKNTFKSALLPFLEGLGEGLKQPMHDFLDWIHKSGGFTKIFDSAEKIGKTVGDLIVGIYKFVTDNPIKTLIMGGAALVIGKAAQWIFNGKMLALGFNSAVSGGGNGSGGIMDMFTGGNRQGSFGRSASRHGFTRGSDGRLMRGAGRTGIGGRLLGGMKGFGLGLLAEGGAMAIDYGRENWMDDPNSDTGKMLGVGSNALSGAGYGAMIGSIIPGIGTAIGALIGGIAGAAKGIFEEYSHEDKAGKISKYDDVILRAGQAPVGINPADDVVAAKKGGPVDKALSQNNGITSNITFSPININGKIELVGSGVSKDLDLNDPIFMRDLSKVIREEVRKSIGGGKLNPNPL